jgi:uncharacterized membrane protein
MESASPLKRSLTQHAAHKLKNYFIAGILVTAPVGLTVYIVWSVLRWVDEQIVPLIPGYFQIDQYLPIEFPGLGLIIVLCGLTLIGAVTANFLGQFFVRIGDKVFTRTPIIRSLYGLLKQSAEMLFGDKRQAFRQVVLVPYPTEHSMVIGFITGPTHRHIREAASNDLVGVFVPFSPIPTTGFLLYFRQEQIRPLRLSVEEAWKLIFSTGLVTSEPASAANHH